MTSVTSTSLADLVREPAPPEWAKTALASAVKFWFLCTFAGQLVFAAYIAALYGRSALRGDFNGWNAVMTHGHILGDSVGNVAIGVHLLLALVVMMSGALQLVPGVRHNAPAFHRWNGRLYLAGAVMGGLTGLYMVWFRGAVGDLVQHLGTSLNALLILLFAGMALRRALRRDFASHSRWALRLFLAVGGVWFFRIGLMFWLAIHGGPAGFNPDTFTGPFLSFLAYAQYLLPLAVLELYLRCRTSGGVMAHIAMAAVLTGVTLAMSLGIAVATVGMWLPRM
ncbi:DUF2306 domain-containing protein [Undibacterium terreum]|uniref:DUF2306 domain-containing protein n=1 Tax=Undibacterium terreum TaxID=1224302 RepID=A0A916V0G5_9BURK|nr:DUF2306 domain-containing protein [Undibacterium terreum]GGD00700.1 hypothetical protein GCM10011396_55330 [Undibacterium terreum]